MIYLELRFLVNTQTIFKAHIFIEVIHFQALSSDVMYDTTPSPFKSESHMRY